MTTENVGRGVKVMDSLTKISIDHEKCNLCRACIDSCPKRIFHFNDDRISLGDTEQCIGCKSCESDCPENAIEVVTSGIKKFWVSRSCNNKCIMCYEKDRNKRPECSTEEIIKTFQNEIDGNERMIILHGAEPTMRKDFFQLLKKARQLNPGARLFFPTNGRMFSYEKYAKEFSGLDLGDVKITFSINGSEEKTHDRITGVKGSFRQSVNGLRNLVEHGHNVHINVVILKQNYRQIPEIAEKFLGIGAKGIQFSLVEPFRTVMVDRYTPRFGDFMPYLRKAMGSSEKVRVKNIPECFLKGFGNERMSTANYFKAKPEKCRRCREFDGCAGVWRAYLKLYGDEDLKPILVVIRHD